MSSSIEQLHQLTIDELCILCLNYGIPRYQVANLERRHLERRLHVAIISERARMRALDRFYGDRDEESTYDTGPRQSFECSRAHFTDWDYFKMRRQGNYSLPDSRFTFSRSRGGVDYYKKMALYPYDFDAMSTVNSEDFENGAEESEESDESENSEASDDEISRQSSDILGEESEESEFMDDIDQAIDRKQLSIDEHEQSAQNSQPGQVIAHGNELQYSESEEFEFVEANDQVMEQQSSGVGMYEQGSQNSQAEQAFGQGNKAQISDEIDLNTAERFNWISESNLDLSQDTDPDRSSEHEICTVNFLEDFQGDIIKTASRTISNLRIRLEDNQQAIGASRQSSQAELSPWQYLIDLIFSNVQEKLNADNVGYSILCCTLVICTYVGIKLLK